MAKRDAIDKQIEEAWYRLSSGVPVSVLDISKIFSESRADIEAGKSVDEAVTAARDKYRQDTQ